MKKFQRDLIIYLTVLVISVLLPGIKTDILPFYIYPGSLFGVEPYLSVIQSINSLPLMGSYLAELILYSGFFTAISAWFYSIRAVFLDSFAHDMDQDWWMSPFILGFLGVAFYYIVREDYI